MYCPLLEMVPAPALASPPLTVQFTVTAPPPLKLAENCSTAEPDVLSALHPVQFVSTVAVPGETVSVPFDEDPPDADPPQPASRNSTGTAPAASARAGQRRSNFHPDPRKEPSACLPGESERRFCDLVFTAVLLLNFSGAFLANCPAQFLLDVVRSFC